jgi:mannose-6-phosphate isomerase-like protein (cupin superfamily)
MTVIQPTGGEVVGDSPERRVEILCEHDAVHVTWTRYGPRREGADLHIHRRHTDLFYVLEGEMTVRLGAQDELVAVPAGCVVRVPPFVVHGFRNGSDAELRYLNLHAPGLGFADYLRAMRDGRSSDFDQEPPPGDGERPIVEAVIGGAERLGEGVTLLADSEEIAIAELSAIAGDEHVHERPVELLYALEGELDVSVAGEEHRAGAGCCVRIEPGVPHAVAPATAARVLAVHAPGSGLGAFLRALADGGDARNAAERSGFDRRAAGQRTI